MAYRGLPVYAREGTSLGQMGQAAPIQPTSNNGGGIPDWLKILGAGLGGAALNGLGPGGNALGALIDGLKKLLNRGRPGGTVQGNKPNAGGTGLPIGNAYDPSKYFPGWDPRVSDPYGNPYLPSDPGVYYGHGGGASPSDPSGGTGIGPGMQDYYNNGWPNWPGSWPDPGLGGYPNDPSGGTGVGPGMQSYYGMFPPLADPSEE